MNRAKTGNSSMITSIIMDEWGEMVESSTNMVEIMDEPRENGNSSMKRG